MYVSPVLQGQVAIIFQLGEQGIIAARAAVKYISP
jgi:hypothetical protein